MTPSFKGARIMLHLKCIKLDKVSLLGCGYSVYFVFQICLGDSYISLFSDWTVLLLKKFFILSCHLCLWSSAYRSLFSLLEPLKVYWMLAHTCIYTFEDSYHFCRYLKCILRSSAANHFQNRNFCMVFFCILFYLYPQNSFYFMLTYIYTEQT